MFGYVLDLCGGQFGVHGEGEYFSGELFGDGEVALAVAEVAIGGLQVQRAGVIDHGGNAGGGQLAAQGVAVLRSHAEGVLMVCVGSIRSLGRRDDAGAVGQCLVVETGGVPAGGDVLVEMAQLHAEHGRLQRIKAGVDAHVVVVVFLGHAVVGDAADTGGQGAVVGEECASVAEAAQVLGGEEGGAARIAHGAGLVHRAVGEGDLGAEGLAGVLDHIEVVLACDGQDAFHVGALAEQVHGQDGAGAGGDGRLDLGGIHAEGVGADIHEHGAEAEQGYNLSRGHECEGYGEHLIAGLQAEGHEGKLEGVGAAGAGERVRRARVCGQLQLESAHLRPVDVAGLREHAAHRLINLFAYVCILTLQVNHLDVFHHIQKSRAKIG